MRWALSGNFIAEAMVKASAKTAIMLPLYQVISYSISVGLIETIGVQDLSVKTLVKNKGRSPQSKNQYSWANCHSPSPKTISTRWSIAQAIHVCMKNHIAPIDPLAIWTRCVFSVQNIITISHEFRRSPDFKQRLLPERTKTVSAN